MGAIPLPWVPLVAWVPFRCLYGWNHPTNKICVWDLRMRDPISDFLLVCCSVQTFLCIWSHFVVLPGFFLDVYHYSRRGLFVIDPFGNIAFEGRGGADPSKWFQPMMDCFGANAHWCRILFQRTFCSDLCVTTIFWPPSIHHYDLDTPWPSPFIAWTTTHRGRKDLFAAYCPVCLMY